MSDFHEADLSIETKSIQELFSEYLQWIYLKVSDKLGFGFDVKAKVSGDMADLQIFSQPNDGIILATVNNDHGGLRIHPIASFGPT